MRTLPHGAELAPLTPGYEPRPYWWDGVDVPQPGLRPVAGDGRRRRGRRRVHGPGGCAGDLPGRARTSSSSIVTTSGRGASSRNGGMAHPGGKRDVSDFLAEPSGRRLWDETVAAFEALGALGTELGIEFDWQRRGHLELAHHPRVALHQRTVAAAYALDRRGGPLPRCRRAR